MISAENDLKNQSPIVGKTYVCDRDMIRKERIVLKTALATFVLLLFFFTQGAIVVIMGIDGVPSALIRGAVIWGLVAITLAYSINRYKGISKLDFAVRKKGRQRECFIFRRCCSLPSSILRRESIGRSERLFCSPTCF